MENDDTLRLLAEAFNHFRSTMIDQMANLQVEIDAVLLTAMEATGRPFDEERMKTARLHCFPRKSGYVDDLRLKFRVPPEAERTSLQ